MSDVFPARDQLPDMSDEYEAAFEKALVSWPPPGDARYKESRKKALRAFQEMVKPDDLPSFRRTLERRLKVYKDDRRDPTVKRKFLSTFRNFINGWIKRRDAYAQEDVPAEAGPIGTAA